jgi:hypothetical protein
MWSGVLYVSLAILLVVGIVVFAIRFISKRFGILPKIKREIKLNKETLAELKASMRKLHLQLNEINRRSQLIMQMDESVVEAVEQFIENNRKLINDHIEMIALCKKKEAQLVNMRRQIELLGYLGIKRGDEMARLEALLNEVRVENKDFHDNVVFLTRPLDDVAFSLDKFKAMNRGQARQEGVLVNLSA